MMRTSLALKLVLINYDLPDDICITLKHLAEKNSGIYEYLAVPTVLYLT
jgi:hypothetical protein